MVHRLGAGARGLHENAEVLAQGGLADEIVKLLRPYGPFRQVFLGEDGRDGSTVIHAVSSFSPARIRSSTGVSPPSDRIAPDTAPNASPRR